MFPIHFASVVVSSQLFAPSVERRTPSPFVPARTRPSPVATEWTSFLGRATHQDAPPSVER